MAVTRRRSSRDEEPEDERDERPTRRRKAREDEDTPRRGRSKDSDDAGDDEDESPRRSRGRSRARDEEDDDDAPRRSRGRSRGREGDEDDEAPRRGRRDRDQGGSRRRSGTRGFSSYSSKKRSSGSFADEFKPGANNPTLIKILDEEPFDTYNQHWVDDLPKGERKSYVCLDDDYFGDKREECPLCEIGEGARTFALFNVLDLSNPRKPEVKVWAATATVTDHLERAAAEKKTSPINRDDLYWEVELVKKGKRYNWDISPVKARDLEEDFDLEPLDADELEDFSESLFDSREAVTKVDSYEELAELADSLD